MLYLEQALCIFVDDPASSQFTPLGGVPNFPEIQGLRHCAACVTGVSRLISVALVTDDPHLHVLIIADRKQRVTGSPTRKHALDTHFHEHEEDFEHQPHPSPLFHELLRTSARALSHMEIKDLLQRLTEVSIRQQQIVEHLATQQGRTEEELAAIQVQAAQHVPLPDPRAQATRLLPKMTAHDDVEAFLRVFESTATREGWAIEEWALALAPLLTGEAQRAYFSLPPAAAESYAEVKREILARLGLSSTCATQQFHDWEYRARVPARAQATELGRLAQHWLLEGEPTAVQVVEWVVIDRLLRALPRSHRQAVGMRNPTTILELVEAIELADAVQHREAGDRVPPFPRKVVQERRTPEGASRTVNRPAVPSPQDEPMPTAEHTTPPRTWLVGCILHQSPSPTAPEADITINGAVTLVHSQLCPPQPGQKSLLPVTCVHGDTRQVPVQRVTISAGPGVWSVEAGLVNNLPVAVLLGRDWPASPPGKRRHRRRLQGPRRRLALLASDSRRDAGLRRGSFAKEQREDDRLKHCWDQVRVIDQKDVLPLPHPLPHFIQDEYHPVDPGRFHWPGLDADVKAFCQACPTCQITAPRTPSPSPLIPLPIIEVPFERIGLDLVGPLPKSARGHEHILVIVDYATRYSEAVPLRKATAKAIAQELFLLASRVGIPSEILTDQGTLFMSRLMADLCRLLRVKQLRTTVYHPQTDGLVERFNQTLKQMLRRVAAEDKRDWDIMIPYVMFGIREVPQASTGFTPFELLFGRQPQGLLDVAREAWEQQPAPHRTIIEHVKQMRERINRVMPLVREHLSQAQQAQQRHYNRAAQPWEFHPGDRHGPGPHGPFTVTEKVGPVTYRIQQPGKRRNEQLYHINLLKRWSGTRDQIAALSLTEPVVVDINPHLSAAQKAELQHLVGQFPDVFSSRPGQTNVIQHDIRTPPGVIVRQRPYRVPEARRQVIEEEVQEMLKLGVIEPSRSPWSSPIVMVPKPDGTLCFCKDFHRLNEVSQFDGYPMPRVDELLDRLGRARYITTLDLMKGYWQGPCDVSAYDGHHPAAAYLDDMVVHSEAWEDHLDRLRRVLSKLRQAGLTTNPRKCHLAQSEAKYGPFCASPLTDLTRKGQPEKVRWTTAAEEALARIKTALTTTPVLRAPDFGCPFLLQTDASDTGLGAVLSQVQEGEEHPIIYISRKLSPAERNYATVEKEALAIKWAVLELRYYLLGRKFTLVTDHAPLQWMSRAKDTNARDFHFEVRHRAGATNTNADGLSRIWTAYAGLSGVIPHPPHDQNDPGGVYVTGVSGLISVTLVTDDPHLHVLIIADRSPLLPNQRHGFISHSHTEPDRQTKQRVTGSPTRKHALDTHFHEHEEDFEHQPHPSPLFHKDFPLGLMPPSNSNPYNQNPS
ncbi:Retrovirus-related Pol polyprotein from transposon 17.6 [Labeo rohita]|uniref:Gypsy retrotransposon integrase-like protein 1 n=1 Tax=Labeo rohita TaxID=84645 RepID=A0ABQ8LR14_LABRO|nr:Retrovirus-related Pol polyprotein from transposon 17.6 [Labeo rohita]